MNQAHTDSGPRNLHAPCPPRILRKHKHYAMFRRTAVDLEVWDTPNGPHSDVVTTVGSAGERHQIEMMPGQSLVPVELEAMTAFHNGIFHLSRLLNFTPGYTGIQRLVDAPGGFCPFPQRVYHKHHADGNNLRHQALRHP